MTGAYKHLAEISIYGCWVAIPISHPPPAHPFSNFHIFVDSSGNCYVVYVTFICCSLACFPKLPNLTEETIFPSNFKTTIRRSLPKSGTSFYQDEDVVWGGG